MLPLKDDRPPVDVPVLTDGVVTLRAHRAEDADRCLEQCVDPLSVAWTTVPVPYSWEMAHDFVTRAMPTGWAEDREWAFAIEVDGPEGPQYGGTCSLRNEGDGRAEIAYGSHPAIRGTGAVERALRLLLDWGFTDKGLRTVIWWADRGNWASRKTAWRLGFTVEGTLRAWLPQRGVLHDAWVGTLRATDPREPDHPWLDCPVLEGEGLRLRPVAHDDVDRILEACTDPRTHHWLGQLPSPYTRDDAVAYVESRTEQQATGQGVTWAVTEPASTGDRILATVGWFHWTPGTEAEIGYWTHPDARGRGVMTRAVRLVTQHVFDTLDLRRVTVFAAAGNTASRHVAEACGYRLYGIERYGAWVRDDRVDMALYDVTAEEWRSAVTAPARSERSATTSTTSPASASGTPTSSGER